MRIAVVGAGAVGGYFGGRLAQAGEDVTFIVRGASLRALSGRGLEVESLHGDFVISPVRATDDPSAAGEMDVVLLAVKAWQVEEVAKTLSPMIGSDTVVVPLQNGVETAPTLAEILGRDAVAGGLCQIISMLAGPGRVRHIGGDPYIAFGELDGRGSGRMEALFEVFAAASVRAEILHDVEAALWRKFMLVASFGGVGGVTRSPIGVIFDIPETQALVDDVMGEVLAVGLARGVDLSPADAERAVSILQSIEPSSTSSMQRDIDEGRPSELENLSGAVVRLGRESHTPTPVNRFIYSALLPAELAARRRLGPDPVAD